MTTAFGLLLLDVHPERCSSKEGSFREEDHPVPQAQGIPFGASFTPKADSATGRIAWSLADRRFDRTPIRSVFDCLVWVGRVLDDEVGPAALVRQVSG